MDMTIYGHQGNFVKNITGDNTLDIFRQILLLGEAVKGCHGQNDFIMYYDGMIVDKDTFEVLHEI